MFNNVGVSKISLRALQLRALFVVFEVLREEISTRVHFNKNNEQIKPSLTTRCDVTMEQKSHRRKVIQFARYVRRHTLAVWVPVVCVLVSRIHVSDVFSLAVRRCAVGSLTTTTTTRSVTLFT